MRKIIMIICAFTFSNIYSQNESRLVNSFTYPINFLRENYKSRFTFGQADNIATQKHSLLNLSGQVLAGSAVAVVLSFLPTGLLVASEWGSERSISGPALGMLAVSSYFFGAAVGVHWVAKSENPNLSLWGTFGYSAIGGGVGVVLIAILASQYETIPGVGGVFVALCPIIGAMFYASFISDWPQENQKISFYKNNISHKDLIEQTKLFNIELLRINLFY